MKKMWFYWEGESRPRHYDRCLESFVLHNPGIPFEIIGRGWLEEREENYGMKGLCALDERPLRTQILHRADVARWIAVYENGGVALDVDFLWFRPLPDWYWQYQREFDAVIYAGHPGMPHLNCGWIGASHPGNRYSEAILREGRDQMPHLWSLGEIGFGERLQNKVRKRALHDFVLGSVGWSLFPSYWSPRLTPPRGMKNGWWGYGDPRGKADYVMRHDPVALNVGCPKDDSAIMRELFERAGV